jgi:hypothetical protein
MRSAASPASTMKTCNVVSLPVSTALKALCCSQTTSESTLAWLRGACPDATSGKKVATKSAPTAKVQNCMATARCQRHEHAAWFNSIAATGNCHFYVGKHDQGSSMGQGMAHMHWHLWASSRARWAVLTKQAYVRVSAQASTACHLATERLIGNNKLLHCRILDARLVYRDCHMRDVMNRGRDQNVPIWQLQTPCNRS